MSSDTTLTAESVEAVARRVVELVMAEAVEPPAAAPPVLIDAAEVGLRLGLARSTVYEKADELGAIRVGTGRRPRLRFDQHVVETWATARRPPGRQQRQRLGARRTRGNRRVSPRRVGADLLPIGGAIRP